MQITIDEYNAVVTGLRTQMELQRTLLQEKDYKIEAQTRAVNDIRELRGIDEKSHQEQMDVMRATVDTLVQELKYIEEEAKNPDNGAVIAGTGFAFQAVQALRQEAKNMETECFERIANLEAQLKTCCSRKRKK